MLSSDCSTLEYSTPLSSSIAGESTIEAEQVLTASGRRPNIKDLHLEKAGIRVAASGGIEVDEFMRTSHPDMHAAGDATGPDQAGDCR